MNATDTEQLADFVGEYQARSTAARMADLEARMDSLESLMTMTTDVLNRLTASFLEVKARQAV